MPIMKVAALIPSYWVDFSSGCSNVNSQKTEIWAHFESFKWKLQNPNDTNVQGYRAAEKQVEIFSQECWAA